MNFENDVDSFRWQLDGPYIDSGNNFNYHSLVSILQLQVLVSTDLFPSY